MWNLDCPYSDKWDDLGLIACIISTQKIQSIVLFWTWPVTFPISTFVTWLSPTILSTTIWPLSFNYFPTFPCLEINKHGFSICWRLWHKFTSLHICRSASTSIYTMYNKATHSCSVSVLGSLVAWQKEEQQLQSLWIMCFTDFNYKLIMMWFKSKKTALYHTLHFSSGTLRNTTRIQLQWPTGSSISERLLENHSVLFNNLFQIMRFDQWWAILVLLHQDPNGCCVIILLSIARYTQKSHVRLAQPKHGWNLLA